MKTRRSILPLLLIAALTPFACAQAQNTISVWPDRNTGSLLQTPSVDLRGPNATAASLPFSYMRPSATDTQEAIDTRTANIQRLIDIASDQGGGKVMLPAGVFAVDQIIIRDRVQLVGAGQYTTFLIAASSLAAGEALIKSEDFDTLKAEFDSDHTTAPQWRSHGCPGGMAVRHMTLDGMGVFKGSTGDIDVDWESYLDGGNNIGIQIYGQGTEIEGVRVSYFDGRGVELYRGNGTRSGPHQALDDPVVRIISLQCVQNDGDGLYIANFPDGVIWHYEAVDNGGDGMELDCNSWQIHQVHNWGNDGAGIRNNGSNYYVGHTEVENSGLEGFVNDTNATGTFVAAMKCFDNQLTGGTGHVRLEAPAQIHFSKLVLKDTDGVVGVMLASGARDSTLTGEFDIESGATNATVVDAKAVTGGQQKVDLEGWAGNVDGTTIYKFRSTSRGNDIRLKFGGLGTNGEGFASMNGAESPLDPDASNRIIVFYDDGTVTAGEAVVTDSGSVVETVPY